MIHATDLSLLVLAQAQEGASPMGGGSMNFLFMGLMFAVIYFLLIRPASKQRKEHVAMLQALKKDDEVITTGGIVGKIASLDDKLATIEIADKVKVRVLRDRIAGRYAVNAPVAPESQKGR
jgi:preprotein translocase subunit YajC